MNAGTAPPSSPASPSPSDALRFGWETLKRNVGMSLGLSLAGLVLALLLNGVAQVTQRYAILSMGFTILTQLVETAVALVWIRFALAVHDGRSNRLSDLVPDGTTFLNFLAASILYSVLVSVGLILLVVPGIYLAVRYGLVTFLVADGRADVLGAFRRSSVLTAGVRWRLFLVMLAILLLNLVGALLFGIGLLFTIPMSVFAMTFVYRRLVAARFEHEQFVVGPPAGMPVWR